MNWMTHPIVPKCLLSQGLVTYADRHGCWWLLDAAVSHVATNAAIQAEPIVFFTLSASGRGLKLVCTDGGKGGGPEVVLARQKIPVSDFPLAELPCTINVERYAQDLSKWVLMLPEER